MDGRMIVTEIDDKEQVVFFDQYGKKKKITGTKMGAILGWSRFSTPFKIALEIARIYPGDPPSKYTEAGNAIEPIIRDHLQANPELVREVLGYDNPVSVEDPVPKEKCGYDHFHNNEIFGGLVDGYIDSGGKHVAILEIKTSRKRELWLDENQNTIVPADYLLQAGLYAELSNLDDIVFAVGFLEDSDYLHPNLWKPTQDNFMLVYQKKPDMSKPMKETEDWYHRYIDAGETPPWEEKDLELVKWLKAFNPSFKGKNGSKTYQKKSF